MPVYMYKKLKNETCNRQCNACSTAIIFYMFISYIFLCCWFSLLVYFSSGQRELIRVFIRKTMNDQEENVLQPCVSNLLDRRHYRYEDFEKNALEAGRLTSKLSKRNTCQLLSYTTRRAVICFDAIHREHLNGNYPNMPVQQKFLGDFHIVFMGDSRIRQQFFNFLKLIPDYDRQKKLKSYHEDMEITSEILRVRVSFLWRPLLDDSLNDTIHQWIASNEFERPYFILLSIEVHHMLKSNMADFDIYRKRLVETGAILNELGRISKIIWLNQYPTVDFYAHTNDLNTDIHSEKIHHYNEAVRRVLKEFSFIQLWDSSNFLAEEYVRTCTIFRDRMAMTPIFLKTGTDWLINHRPYIDCVDFVHTGYIALSQASELLYNEICNAYPSTLQHEV